MTLLNKKIIIFFILLIISFGVAGYFSLQNNLYSKDVLKLEIIGPSEAEISQEVEYFVKYKNNGDIRLDDPELVFEYPDNSITQSPLRVIKGSEELGDAIYPGEERTFSFKGRLLGKENEIKTAKAYLSYRPKNLKAYYESSTTFTVVIKKVSLSFDFDLPSKLESGKDVNLGIVYYSNLDYSLSDLKVIIEYPSGFEFIDSDPEGLEKNEWEISFLNKNQGGKIEVNGKLDGKVGDKKVFNAKLGIWNEGELVILKEANWGVEIIQPSLYVSQQINGNPEYIASFDDLLHYEIFFRNIGEDDLTNLFLMVELEGEAFDLSSIVSKSGEFNLGDDSIIFDWRNNPDLRFLSSKKEGMVEFWVRVKDDLGTDGNIPSNSVIKNRVYLSQAWQDFEVKVNSKMDISQKIYFDDAVFGNLGPIPPEVGKRTTYTVTWQVKNYYNEVKNVKVKSILPDNVSLTGDIFPEAETENFAFDSDSGGIVWSIGDMSAGEGIINQSPNISFQISLIPRSSQRGTTPEIMEKTVITGEDDWTNQNLKFEIESVDTTLPDDDTISEKEGRVK